MAKSRQQKIGGDPTSPPQVTFQAAVYKVQTLVDGGIRVTLDLAETEIPAAAALMECQREGIYLEFTAKATI